MVWVVQNLPTEISPTGVFGDLKLEPEGVEPKYFSNGTRAVSSIYLETVMKELNKQDPNIKVIRHDNLTRAIEREYKDCLRSSRGRSVNFNHSYYDMEEDTYYFDAKHPNSKHLWMSKDLCLNVAAKYSNIIRLRVIDDLNRLQTLVEMQSGQVLPQPSLQAYLPGTIEEQYREKGIVDLLSGESLGFYPLARVKRLWSEQRDVPEDTFDKVYDKSRYYADLRHKSDELGRTVQLSAASRGGTLNLYHISVLKEYFKDIDFSSLES